MQLHHGFGVDDSGAYISKYPPEWPKTAEETGDLIWKLDGSGFKLRIYNTARLYTKRYPKI